MRTFAEHNPIAVAIYFLSVTVIAMFSMDPTILTLSLLGSLLLFFSRNKFKHGKSHLYTLLLFIILTLVNPLVSHNGVTVLFVINNNPITLEALIYGAASAVMIVSVMYWFRSFSQIMTSDKLLYIFGALSPKLALIFSMALRYMPLFTAQSKKINGAQRVIGLYKDDNIVDSFRGGLRIFSVMISWALENGIVTADSMTARGYGIGKRSRFSLFTFRSGDIFLLTLSILFAIISAFGCGTVEFTYYPAITSSNITLYGVIGYISYAVLVLLPTFIEVKEAIKWKYLKSKI